MALNAFGGAGYLVPGYNAALIGSKGLEALKGPGGPGFDEGMLARRKGEIDKFVSNLYDSRQRYNTALGNMYSSAFQRFIPAQQARVAARGLSMGGGAYNSSLGREVARYQSELEPSIYQGERADILAENDARQSLFGSGFGASNQAIQGAKAAHGQMLGMVGGLGGTIVGGMLGGPPGAAIGGSLGKMATGSGSMYSTPVGGGRQYPQGSLDLTNTNNGTFGSIYRPRN